MTVYWMPRTSDDYLLPLRRLAYRNRVEIYSIGTRVRLAQPAGALQDKELADLRKWDGSAPARSSRAPWRTAA